jgi:CelD/BcsL family acetyltransferase involved in cellulose biosynthesis
MTTEVRALTPDDLRGLADEWGALERRSAPAHYSLAHAWLVAWAQVYAPPRLLLVRITGADGGTRALGLIEASRGGRWRFAGGHVTPQRRLLCDPTEERVAWAAWSEWLARHRRRWAILEAGGVPPAAAQVPGARIEPVSTYALALPETFDAYLAGRSRRALRQKLNRLERAEAAVREVEPPGHPAALERFIALHARRAADKGEHHPSVDARLCRLLLSLPRAEGAPQLRVFALGVPGGDAGVSVRLDHGRTAYFYNAGFDPAAGELSPGVVLELASIRDAIGRGLVRFDLGPGEYRYKRDLGGERSEFGRLVATSPSPLGALAGAAYRARRRVRD